MNAYTIPSDINPVIAIVLLLPVLAGISGLLLGSYVAVIRFMEDMRA